ncbi:trehalase family glycosidase [Lentisphaerota bacterium WC36G]|nr:hypothetical protein LJT99_03610 [Lentisphaerae bacterium WC36]
MSKTCKFKKSLLSTTVLATSLMLSGTLTTEVKATETFDVFKAENVKNYQQFIPEVIFSEHPEYVELYKKAWKIANTKVKFQPGLPQSPYIDEGLWDDTIWIWDTAFMVMFSRYAPEAYPGVESLRNFYDTLHGQHKGKTPLVVWHPDNPPLFAWVEYDNYKISGNKKHISDLLNNKKYLQTHYKWFNSVPYGWRYTKGPRKSAPTRVQKHKNGYSWNGISSGMDNTPRGRGVGYTNTLWVDAIAQQGLSALYISKMFKDQGDEQKAAKWLDEYNKIKSIVNKYYWDKKDGFYYDISLKDNKFVKVMTPASFWPVLAEMASKEQVAEMVKQLKSTKTLGGFLPIPTIARNDQDFDPKGRYWRGGMWLPTSYMTIKAIDKYGYYDLSRKLSLNIIDHMSKTYQQYSPHTIWECYNPNEYKPATKGDGKGIVREDFCGWSALGPISLFIEDVLGFYDIDAINKTISYNPYPKGKSGIKKLRFGGITTDIIKEGNIVNVKSDGDYTLKIRLAKDTYKKVKVTKGNTKITLPTKCCCKCK